MVTSHPLNIKALVRLLRPTHWVKNGFVLAPLIFTGQFTQKVPLFDSFIAFFLFSLGASTVYIVNDYHDTERDRNHPVKRLKRPLANGSVSKLQALILLLSLYGILIPLGILWNPQVLGIILGYIALNFAYTRVLKAYPIVDIFCISFCFILRISAGASALGVGVSPWMMTTTFFLGLLLASLKRRQELRTQQKHSIHLTTANTAGSQTNRSQSRRVLKFYSIKLMNRYAEISTAGTLIFYALFITLEQADLIFTIFPVIYGLFRYWFLVEDEKNESPTDVLISDWQLIFTVMTWGGLCLWLLK